VFDGLTDNAKLALNRARMAANEFGHSYLGAEHLLYGLLAAKENGAGRILAAFRVKVDDLQRNVSSRMPPAERSRSSFGQLPFTPQAKRSLELAMQAAKDSRHERVGTEHLLVGLSECGSELVTEVLRELGLTAKKLRFELMDCNGPPKKVEEREVTLEWAAAIARQLGDEDTARKIEALIQRLWP